MNPLSIELMAESDRKERELNIELDALRADNNRLRLALRALVTRCDGAEGLQDDGSNMSTIAAHAALGDFEEFSKGTIVTVSTTNNGLTTGTLIADYCRPLPMQLEIERADGSTYVVLIEGYRIKSVTREL